MTIHVPLTPHQEQFVRDQLASGRFHSEREVVGEAFRLLENLFLPHSASPGSQKPSSEIGPEASGSAAEYRGRPSGNDASAVPVRRSPYGIFADIRSDISAEDISEARREMWAGFPRSDP